MFTVFFTRSVCYGLVTSRSCLQRYDKVNGVITDNERLIGVNGCSKRDAWSWSPAAIVGSSYLFSHTNASQIVE